jgi:hypothetical protein
MRGIRSLTRMRHGSAFYLDAQIRLVRPEDEWRFVEDGLEILAGKSDKNLDHEGGLDDQYEQWLAEKQKASEVLGQN